MNEELNVYEMEEKATENAQKVYDFYYGKYPEVSQYFMKDPNLEEIEALDQFAGYSIEDIVNMVNNRVEINNTLELMATCKILCYKVQNLGFNNFTVDRAELETAILNDTKYSNMDFDQALYNKMLNSLLRSVNYRAENYDNLSLQEAYRSGQFDDLNQLGEEAFYLYSQQFASDRADEVIMSVGANRRIVGDLADYFAEQQVAIEEEIAEQQSQFER